MRSSPDSDPALSDPAASTSIDSDKCIRIKRKFRSSSAAAGSVNEVLVASESGRSKDPAAASSSKKVVLDSEEVNLQVSDSSESKLVDWKDCTETELENLLLESIQSNYKDAVVKLSSMGYKKNAEVAVVYAIVKSGFRCIPSLVKSAEGYLKAAEVLSAEQSYRSSLLPSKVPMEKFALAELVREMLCDRPGMTRADALWCLILTNLDVNAAIALESKPSATSAQEQTTSTSASVLASTASKSAGTETVLAQQPSSTSASGTISLSISLATDCEQEVDKSSQDVATDLGNPSLAESSDLSSASSGGGADKLEHNEHSACTELSLALGPDLTRTKTDAFGSSEAKKRKSAENEAVDQEKDRVIKQLQEQVNSLNVELEERTDWARTKVLQAAKRLTKDVSELQKLRAEREEALRAEQSSSKRFLDLENALRKTGTQLDQAKVALRKLDDSNAEIRAELQAAKLSAAESVESSREISKREKKSQKQAQSWEKQRAKLQEELAAERRKLVDQLAQTRERQHQAEVRSRQESKARDEAVSRFEAEKLAREQAEAAGRRSVESIQRKSEADSRGLRDEIRKLEQEVRKLRFGFSDSCGAPEVIYRTTYETAAATDHESSAPVRRDRECVMCLCEEMSVVFLPCAHQVVCIKCNELHQKQGMNDCPSCRTRIQQRIKVYGASS